MEKKSNMIRAFREYLLSLGFRAGGIVDIRESYFTIEYTIVYGEKKILLYRKINKDCSVKELNGILMKALVDALELIP